MKISFLVSAKKMKNECLCDHKILVFYKRRWSQQQDVIKKNEKVKIQKMMNFERTSRRRLGLYYLLFCLTY